MMGLFKAIMSYDIDKNDNFKAYAHKIIIREMILAIRRDNRDKNKDIIQRINKANGS